MARPPADEGESSGSDRVHGMFTSRRVALNSGLNLAGQLLPLVGAYFAIPLLTRGLGAERFGVLALGWLIVGYFGLFDFGLGRAVTQALAERIGTPREHEVPRIMCSALVLMLGLGLLGALVGAAASVPLVHHALRVPANLSSETVRSFVVFSATVPFVLLTAGLRGVLEAKQRFDLVNGLRAPLGIAMYVTPVLVLPFSRDLLWIAVVLLIVRVIAFVAHLLLVVGVVQITRTDLRFNASYVTPLLRIGGWMTVTNIVGPVLVSLDRFLIGAVVSVAAVAYYAAPYEAITKLWLLPAALTGVLFPAFAAGPLVESGVALRLYERAVKVLLLALLPVIIGAVAFSQRALMVWLGPAFAARSTTTLQLLSFGVLFNSLAMVPFALIQGRARPDLTAKTHLLELPAYIVLLWAATKHYGVVGAAFAWSVRCTADAIVLFALAQRLLPVPREQAYRVGSYLLMLLLSMVGLGVLAPHASLVVEALAAVMILLVAAVGLWRWLLSSAERQLIVRAIGSAFPLGARGTGIEIRVPNSQ